MQASTFQSNSQLRCRPSKQHDRVISTSYTEQYMHTCMVNCKFHSTIGFGDLSNWFVTSILCGITMYTNQNQSIRSDTAAWLDQYQLAQCTYQPVFESIPPGIKILLVSVIWIGYFLIQQPSRMQTVQNCILIWLDVNLTRVWVLVIYQIGMLPVY